MPKKYMKKLIPIFLILLVGCQDQNSVQKTTLSATALQSVVVNNTDFNAIVTSFIDMKNAKATNLTNATPSTKSLLHAIPSKYSSATEFNLNGTTLEKNILLSLTPFTASKNFINLITYLNSRYVFNISDLSSLVNQEINARTATTSKSSANLDNAKNEPVSGCQETCDIGQIHTIFNVYNDLMRMGLDDEDAYNNAVIAGSYYVIGCYDGCGF